MKRNIEWLVSDEAGETTSLPCNGSSIDNETWLAVNRRYELSGGVRLYTQSIQVRRKMSVEPQGDESQRRICSQIAEHGQVDVTFPDGVATRITPEQGGLFYPAEMRARYDLAAGERIFLTGYAIIPETFERLLGGNVPPPLRPLFATEWGKSALQTFRTTRPMRKLAKSLEEPGLTGRLLDLFLEGVMMQLLAMQMAALSAGQQTVRPLSDKEEAAVREAYVMLFADMRSPPRILDLAAQVNLNEKRLSEGFRLLFGAPVYETLKRERLIQARQAIESSNVPVKQIAFRVGYSHVTNFINAFKAQFGKPPSHFRKGKGVID